MTAAALQFRDLCFAYPDGTAALRGVNLQIAPGEAVALVGANGAGKSTLLQQIMGLLLPTSGHVEVGDLTVSQATLSAVRRRVGYVFQDADDQLFMPTAYEDVAFGPRNLKLPDTQVQQRVQAALAQVGALHLAQRPPWRLSGGEKRAVALAGVLAMQPEVLVLDEPSAGLDPAARRRLMQLLVGCTQTRVMATHDLDLALDTCSRVLVLHQGQVQADGRPQAIFADATLLASCQLEAPLSWARPGPARPRPDADRQ